MKNAIIWGASGGIGRALAQKLTEEEWNVVGTTRYSNGLDQITQHVIEADVTSPFEVEVAVTSAGQLVGEVDLWIYAAGDITSAKVGEMKSDDWERILGANLNGAFLTTHYSKPLLADDAHLIYVGAVDERLRLPGLSAYAAAKAGLEAFVQALGKEERNWKISLVRPGAVDTPLWDKVPMNLPKKALTPQELAAKILDAYQEEKTGTLDIS